MAREWYASGTRVLREWYGSGTRVVREWCERASAGVSDVNTSASSGSGRTTLPNEGKRTRIVFGGLELDTPKATIQKRRSVILNQTNGSIKSISTKGPYVSVGFVEFTSSEALWTWLKKKSESKFRTNVVRKWYESDTKATRNLYDSCRRVVRKLHQSGTQVVREWKRFQRDIASSRRNGDGNFVAPWLVF